MSALEQARLQPEPAPAAPAAAEALLRIDDLRVRFGAHEAVRGIQLQVAAGETLALVGESGCGKSTTALALLGLLPGAAQRSGQAWFEGQDLLALPPAALRAVRGNRLSMIFQEPMTSLNPVLSIGEQIIEVLQLHQGLAPRAARERAVELLAQVQMPDPRRRVDDHPHQLSGGQRQRVMIAMAVACNPRLLIADEPTTALDVTIQAQILELLRTLTQASGMGLLLITHDLGVVGQWADRVAVMDGGVIVEEGRTAQLFQRARHAYTRGLLGASLRLDSGVHYRRQALPEVRRVRTGGAVVHQLHTRQVQAAPPLAEGAEPLLRVQDLRTVYDTPRGPLVAVDGVSFDLRPGETLGLVGESGCGKSSLSRTLLRLIKPAGGRIVLGGTDIAALPEAALKPLRRQVQMVFQDPYGSLNPRHSVQTILDGALRAHGVAARTERERRIADILDRVGLPAASGRRYPHEFSGGQRQRIGLARALVLRPRLVICDEPVSSLDVSVRAQVLNLLVELKSAFELSYLFISHDLSVVKYIADRVLVMHEGRIVEQGDHASIWSQAQHDYTRELIRAVPAPRFEPLLSWLPWRFAV